MNSFNISRSGVHRRALRITVFKTKTLAKCRTLTKFEIGFKAYQFGTLRAHFHTIFHVVAP
jgi:hypothetical protein